MVGKEDRPEVLKVKEAIALFFVYYILNRGRGKPNIRIMNNLPSRFQLGDFVKTPFADFKINRAMVVKVHFAHGYISYDLEVFFGDEQKNLGDEVRIRAYNIPETLLEAF